MLTHEKMLQFCDSTDGDVVRGERKLQLTLLHPIQTEGTLANNWREGLVKAQTVIVNSVPTFIVFFVRGMNRTLACHGVISLVDGADRMEILDVAMDALAHKNDCDRICFLTARAGLSFKAAKYGYKPMAVYYVKNLEAGR
jgi:hypothetical protein